MHKKCVAAREILNRRSGISSVGNGSRVGVVNIIAAKGVFALIIYEIHIAFAVGFMIVAIGEVATGDGSLL